VASFADTNYFDFSISKSLSSMASNALLRNRTFLDRMAEEGEDALALSQNLFIFGELHESWLTAILGFFYGSSIVCLGF
jgi:hypothetical protein